MKHFKKIIFAIAMLWTNCLCAQVTFEKIYQYLQVHRGFQVTEIDTGNFLFLTDLDDCTLCIHEVEFLKINKYGDTISLLFPGSNGFCRSIRAMSGALSEE